jgi:hypothetical protein
MNVFESLDGALLIDIPAGPTSHDVVDAIRDQFKIKKVGHCGTLDPNATGLLVIVLGRATKLSERLMSSDKVYEGTVKFGETTNSYDADGQITASLPVPAALTVEQLNAEAAIFVGDLLQTPPMVSAVKKDGSVPLKPARSRTAWKGSRERPSQQAYTGGCGLRTRKRLAVGEIKLPRSCLGTVIVFGSNSGGLHPYGLQHTACSRKSCPLHSTPR